MIARQVGRLVGVVVLIASGAYVFVYLYRWEWNRALMAAALFIAIEVALLAVSVLERLSGLARAVERLDAERRASPAVLARVREAAPEPASPFAWLKPDGSQTGVFVPVLLGAGIVLSGLAWVVERIAARTATPVLERGLAARMAALGPPDRLVTVEGDTPNAILLGPSWAPEA